MTTTTTTSVRTDLWAVCALPGTGPEFRFTSAPPRNPLRTLRTKLHARRTRKEARAW